MLKNYFIITFRKIRRQKAYTAITVSGLAIGLACAVLIMLWLQDELSYDRFHNNADQIYRIQVQNKSKDVIQNRAGTPYPLAPELINDYPELANTTRFYNFEEALITINDKQIYENGVILADPKFLDVFSFPLLRGNKSTVLSQPNTVILTQSMAQKYFGDQDPLGKQLFFDNHVNMTITGLIADVPPNSHFNFNMLVSMASLPNVNDMDFNQWYMYNGTYVYTRLDDNVNAAELENKIAGALENYSSMMPDNRRSLYLQPITDIHLHSHAQGELQVNSNPAKLYIFAAIGLMVLIVAGINYVNLTTARSLRGAREAGMRKVLGANRLQLLRQFMGESILISFIAMLLAVLIIALFLPFFNNLAGKSLSVFTTGNIKLGAAIILLTSLVGILSGLYPALIMASYKPVDTIKKLKITNSNGAGSFIFRKLLVVIQFTISIALITGTLIVTQQLDFFRNADLGFDKDLIVTVTMDDTAKKRIETIRESWLNIPGVKAVSFAFKSPIGENSFGTVMEDRQHDQRVGIQMNIIDYDFCDTFGLTLLAGRNFSPEYSTDEQRAVIVNESTIKKLGFDTPQEALGHVYRLGINDINAEIIGVVQDFHINSLQSQITPLVMMYWPEFASVFSVKISSDHIASTIDAMGNTWRELVPDFPFENRFLDEYINSLYQQEEQVRTLVTVFAGLTIFISCLGLLGLAAYSAEQRTKEIGIRKVLGASVKGLLAMLVRDFAGLVIAANIIAWPIAWYTMQKWLNNFAYRIDMGFGPFLIAGLSALCIAVLTISWLTIRAANTNPIKALRYE